MEWASVDFLGGLSHAWDWEQTLGSSNGSPPSGFQPEPHACLLPSQRPRAGRTRAPATGRRLVWSRVRSPPPRRLRLLLLLYDARHAERAKQSPVVFPDAQSSRKPRGPWTARRPPRRFFDRGTSRKRRTPPDASITFAGVRQIEIVSSTAGSLGASSGRAGEKVGGGAGLNTGGAGKRAGIPPAAGETAQKRYRKHREKGPLFKQWSATRSSGGVLFVQWRQF